MALLKAGYWQTTYYPSRYWQEDYWPEYGAPVAPVTEGNVVAGPPVPRPRFPLHLLKLIKNYLEVKQDEPN